MSSLRIDSFSEAFLAVPFIETICGAELRPSLIAGRGLFSLRHRARDEILCVLDGQEVDPRRHPRVMNELEWNALSPTRLLVRPLRTSYGYINHSPSPNVREVRAQGAAAALAQVPNVLSPAQWREAQPWLQKTYVDAQLKTLAGIAP